jgi:hypothetical protein
MEKDLELGKEADKEVELVEWEYIDYHSYIASGVNVLVALDGIDELDKKEKAKIEKAKDQAVYLIRRSVDQLVKQFDEEHD